MMTSVVVTHDMKSAFDVADRIAYLHEGRIYFNGTATQLQQSARITEPHGDGVIRLKAFTQPAELHDQRG